MTDERPTRQDHGEADGNASAAAELPATEIVDQTIAARADDSVDELPTSVDSTLAETHEAPDPYWYGRAMQLRREAAVASSPRRGAALFFELGRIHEARLGQIPEALACYTEAHQRCPDLLVNVRAMARLLLEHGDYSGYVRALDAEVAASASAAERAAILVERGRARLHKLADVDAARLDFEKALEIDSDDPTALDGLGEVHRYNGNWAGLEQVLRRQIKLCHDPALRAALVCQLARLRELRHADLEGAAALYRSALNSDPQHLPTLRALLRTARASRDHATVARVCKAIAQLEHPRVAAALMIEVAHLYVDHLDKPEQAMEAMHAAAEFSPEPAVLALLCNLCERLKRWPELAQVLTRLRDSTDDAAELAAIGLRLALVQQQHLDDANAAIETLREVVHAAPEDLPARQMLGRLYRRQERWEELIGLLSEERELFSAPRRQAATCYRIADIFEHQLGDLDQAIVFYQQAMDAIPDYRPAIRGISRVFRVLGRHEDLISVFEFELSHADGAEQKKTILRRIAEIWQRELDDPAAALSAYERLLALDPNDLGALRALRRIYTIGCRWQDLVETLRTEATRSRDPYRQVTLLCEAAEYQLHHLKQPHSALATYLEVLHRAPDYRPALMAAGRLLKDAHKYDELLKVHRRELDSCQDPAQRTWLLVKIGRLLLEHLGREDEAIQAFTAALKLAPSPLSASDQLLLIHRRHRDPKAVFQQLLKRPLPASARAQALHRRRIAEALLQLDQTPEAVQQLRRALAAANDDACLQLLESLYAASGDRQNLIRLYQLQAERSEHPYAQIAGYHKLASIWSSADHDIERAVRALERLLELMPRDRRVLRQLELLLCRLGRWEELAATLELARESSDDADYQAACATLVATLREDRLDDLPGAAQSAVDVLARYPANIIALHTIERHYRTSGNAEGLLHVMGRHLEATQTLAEEPAVLGAMAALHAHRGELPQALELLRLAAERMPSYLPVLRTLAHVARANGDSEQAALALELEADASAEPIRRIACLLESGHCWQEQGNADQAAAAYHRVLDINPRHQGAVNALNSLYSAGQEYDKLARLLGHVAEHTRDPDARLDLLARIAELQRSRLNDVDAARQTIMRALEIDPNHRGLLTTLAELCRAAQDWKALALTNQRLVRLTEDPLLLKALHFELGRIWEERLPDLDGAVAEYRRVLELDPNDLGTLTRLSELLIKAKDWLPAARATESLISRDDDRNRVRQSHLRLARIYAEGFEDLSAALETCRRALALDPGDPDATEQMSDLLAEMGDLRALNAHLESTLSIHRARIERDPLLVESHRTLLRVFERQRAEDACFVVRSLLRSIGEATEQDREALRRDRPRMPTSPRRPLTADELERLLIHPSERGPLRRVLDAALPIMRKVYEPLSRSTTKAVRIGSRTEPQLADLLRQLQKNSGTGSLHAWLVEPLKKQLWVEDTSPPSIFVSPAIAAAVDRPETRFRLARVMAHIRLSHQIPGRMGAAELERFLSALLTVVCSSFRPELSAAEIEPLAEKIDRLLTRKLRAQLDGPCLELSERAIDPELWLTAMTQSEDRIALALAGDLQAAIHMLVDEQRARHAKGTEEWNTRVRQLLSFAVSDEHLTLRMRLGIALAGR